MLQNRLKYAYNNNSKTTNKQKQKYDDLSHNKEKQKCNDLPGRDAVKMSRMTLKIREVGRMNRNAHGALRVGQALTGHWIPVLQKAALKTEILKLLSWQN